MNKLQKDFFLQDAIVVARELLGKILVIKHNEKYFLSLINETEAYGGDDDDASHANKGKTPRNQIMFEEGGYSYIYLIYGIYSCFNIVCGLKNDPQAVLIRSLIPLNNHQEISQARFGLDYLQLSNKQKNNLLSGPGKICHGLKLTRKDNGKSILGDEIFIIETKKKVCYQLQISKRINIDYAIISRDFPYRYFFAADQYYFAK